MRQRGPVWALPQTGQGQAGWQSYPGRLLDSAYLQILD